MTDASTPAWRPDPTGRHAQRWFDGTRWTEHVADVHGTSSVDPYEQAAAPTQAMPAPQPAPEPEPEPEPEPKTVVAAEPETEDQPAPEPPAAGSDPTTVIETAGAQSDPTSAFPTPVAEPPAAEQPAPTQADPGAAGWAAPEAPTQAEPAATPWSQPAPAPAPAPSPQAATPWGQPAAEAPSEPAAEAAPPWSAPAPPTTWGGAQPGSGQPAEAYPAAPPPATSGFNPAGLVVVVIGGVLAIVGLFALKWVKTPTNGSAKLKDLKNLIDFAKQNGVNDVTFMSKAFPKWGAYVAVVVALLSALAAAFVRVLKPIAFVLGILAAGWCLFFAFDIVHWMKKDAIASGASVQIGAYLAAAGFVIAAIGALLPSKRS